MYWERAWRNDGKYFFFSIFIITKSLGMSTGEAVTTKEKYREREGERLTERETI